ncbi:MAG: transcription factor S [Nanoarchaeota archaeon]
MKFCPKCGSILVPKKSSGKYVYECSCGYSAPVDAGDQVKEAVTEKKDIEIIDEKNSVEANPLVEVDCPKCGHNQAYFWLEQTRSGDESETKFFKCEKCKHTWRDYE